MGKSDLYDVLTLVLLVGGGWYLYTHTDIGNQIKSLFKGGGAGGGTSAGGGAGGGTGAPGNFNAAKGQLIFQGTGKKWSAKDSGKTKRNYASGGSSGTTQWDIKGIGPIKNLEVTCFVNVGSCGDEVSLKVFGPDHSDGNCCWFIMDVNCNTGQFMFGGEGPHPTTSKNSGGTGKSIGSLKNKEVGIKLVVYSTGSGYHAAGYALQGSTWTEMISKDFTQFGDSKKSSTPASNANVQFRTDCTGVKYLVAEAAEIIPPSGGGGSTPNLNTSQAVDTSKSSGKNSKKKSSNYTQSLFSYNKPLPLGYYNSRMTVNDVPYCYVVRRQPYYSGRCTDSYDG